MFEIFKPYVGLKGPPNVFMPVSEREIETAESRLGFRFPTTLRTFYREIGDGFFRQGAKDSEGEQAFYNRILSPSEIAERMLTPFSDPLREGKAFKKLFPLAAREHEIEPGFFLFFSVSDRDHLFLRIGDDAGKVYGFSARSVKADSLKEFFERLYDHAQFFLPSREESRDLRMRERAEREARWKAAGFDPKTWKVKPK